MFPKVQAWKFNEFYGTCTTCPGILSRSQDEYRFILYHRVAIESKPLQVYHSGLIFSPKESITKSQFELQELKISESSGIEENGANAYRPWKTMTI
ncbi:WD40 repeat-like protein [Penicillium manginii]|uniref:WD40 repeat-like protein n=1 Tax=Penicillium manginii TaxID=203109 RepID=UPI002549877A|nr:WD40 repeat-like protein [Penicillium manginii]KAJ5767774.1 WD40 repeat-like protein [Penicillium manginii]